MDAILSAVASLARFSIQISASSEPGNKPNALMITTKPHLRALIDAIVAWFHPSGTKPQLVAKVNYIARWGQQIGITGQGLTGHETLEAGNKVRDFLIEHREAMNLSEIHLDLALEDLGIC
jgi:hypothetical protein